MKILLIVINLLFLISNQSFSQNQQKIDSLLNVFNTVDSDTEKTSILITITDICRHFDTEKALTYCEQAIALSKKINDKNRYYKAINLKGLINLRLGNSKQAISNFNTVINNADKNSREKAISCLNLGNIYAEQVDDVVVVGIKI
jgi:tetratricopeptide (TPR) repeat protein